VALGLDDRLPAVVGGKTATALQKAFGMVTVADLLAHYPRRYAKPGELTALADLPLDENVTLVAQVRSAVEIPMRQKRGSRLDVRLVDDAGGEVKAAFFNQGWRIRELRPGRRGIFSGKVSSYRGDLQLAHPDYELIDADLDDLESAARQRTTVPIPIYPATASVRSWHLQAAIGQVLDLLDAAPDPVPDLVRERRRLLTFRDALERVHRPADTRQSAHAIATLKFQEAFVLQAALLQRRERLRFLPATPREPGALARGFDAALPFELTDDQRAVGAEVARDMAATTPMSRLVQGEVGSGKTMVALRAMLAVADGGGQSALLAPTEVLAAQHLRSIVQTLGPDLAARLRPTLLTGQLGAAERRKALLAIVSGSAAIVIGTHALLSDRVEFYDLGLVVIDEQHRFGVEQREALRRKGVLPHVLVLTATPIPRTVAMTAFGDLDVSTIAQLPAGRSPIESFVVPLAEKPGWIARVWSRMVEELERGRQAFVVVPAINAVSPGAGVDDGDGAPGAAGGDGAGADGAAPRPRRASVAEVTELIRSHPELASRRIEPLHGRMPADEKDAVMRAFAAGTIDVLVSTTVVEVGVDVPNASLMVVLDADRFGISQLHQLRGRIGRGGVPGIALFVTGEPEGTQGRERVDAVAATTDGFALANVDLELRREGDVLGENQSGGRSSLRLLRVVHDAELIAEAREVAAAVVSGDPELEHHPALHAAIRRRLDEDESDFLGKG